MQLYYTSDECNDLYGLSGAARNEKQAKMSKLNIHATHSSCITLNNSVALLVVSAEEFGDIEAQTDRQTSP